MLIELLITASEVNLYVNAMSQKKSVCSVDDFWMIFHRVNLVCRNWKKKLRYMLLFF